MPTVKQQTDYNILGSLILGASGTTSQRVLGRKSGGAGAVEECALSDVLDMVGSAAQGDILYRGASTWTRLGAASSTSKMLLSGGTSANPAWAGSEVLLATASVAVAASSVNINFNSWTLADYASYRIVFNNFVSTTNTVFLLLRTSQNGTTFDSGAADYAYQTTEGITLVTNAGTTLVGIAGVTTSLGNAANRSTSGEIKLYNPNAAKYCKMRWEAAAVDTAGQVKDIKGAAQRLTAAAVQGVQLLFSVGNVDVGATVQVYGLSA